MIFRHVIKGLLVLIIAIILLGAAQLAHAGTPDPGDINIGFSQFVGSPGTGNGQFGASGPAHVAIDSAGDLYVVDPSNQRVQKFDSNGNFLLTWGSSGTGNGQFTYPHGIAVDSFDNVWVTDWTGQNVQKFTSNGSFLGKWGSYGTAPGQFQGAVDIAIDPNDNIYVLESDGKKVQKFNSSFVYQTSWADSTYNFPRGIHCDSTGNVYVAELFGKEVHKYSNTGTLLQTISDAANLGSASDVYTDTSGNIFVADENYNRLVKFGPDGVHKYTFPASISAISNVNIADDGTIYASSKADSTRYVVKSGLYSDNAYLSSISVAGQTLAPVFNKDTTVYSVDVVTDVSSVEITGLVEDSSAVLRINGSVQASGVAKTINLAYGANDITLQVTAENNSTTRTYTVTVNRAADPSKFFGSLVQSGSGDDGGTYYNDTWDWAGWYSGAREFTAIQFDLSGYSGTLDNAKLSFNYAVWDEAGYGTFPLNIYGSYDDSWTEGASLPASNDEEILLNDTASDCSGNEFLRTIDVTNFVSQQLTSDGTKLVTFVLTGPDVNPVDPSGLEIYTYSDESDNVLRPQLELTSVTADTTAPTPGAGGSITTSGLTNNSVTVNWTKATDNTSPQGALQYLVYYSTGNNLDTVENIEANGSVVGVYTADISTKEITGLTPDTTYYFNIIVQDESGNKSCYSTQSVITDITPPIATNVIMASNNADGTLAKVGDIITLSIITSEDIQTPTATIGGNAASVNNAGDADAATWNATYTMQSGDSEGVLNFTLDFSDLAGNSGTQVTTVTAGSTVTFDPTAPEAPSVDGINTDTGKLNLDGITNDPTLRISGTAETNSTVEIFVDGVSIGTTTAVEGSGYWNFDYSGTTLAEGSYGLTAQATDAAGNVSAVSMTFTVVIDLTAPAAPSVDGITSDTGDLNLDGITNDQTLVITGTAEANSTVEVFVGGVSIGTTTAAGGSGYWSFDYSGTPLAEGSYTFTARAADAAGNVSPTSAGFAVVIDRTVPPVPTLDVIGTDSGANNSDGITSDQTLIFSGTAEAGIAVEIYLDGISVGTTTADGTGSWTFDYTGTTLAAGNYVVTARAKDVAGNTSAASADFNLTVDPNAPAPPSVDGINSDTGDLNLDGITNDQTLRISGTAEPNSTVEIFVDGVSIGTTTAVEGSGYWNFDYSGTSLAEGSYIFTARAIDAAGNVSPTSAGFAVVIDTTVPPVPTLAGIGTDTGANNSDGITSDQTLIFSGTAEAGIAVEVYLDGVSIGTTTADGTSSWTFDYTGTTLAAGNYVVTARAKDVAGNTSAASPEFSLTVDPTAPAAPSVDGINSDTGDLNLDGITNDQTLIITGTAEAKSTVEVFAGGVSIGTTTAAEGSGYWSFDYSGTSLAEGSYAFTAKAADAAGNISAESEQFSVTVDVSSSMVTSVSIPANGTYVAGQNLDFTVNFDEPVTVDTAGGTPYIGLNIGGTSANAAYISGNGTANLVFRYVVEAGNMDADGILIGELSANDGSLTDAAGNSAVLTLNSVANSSGVLIDSVSPEITSVAVPANGVYKTADTLYFTVKFTEAVVVDTGGGTPRIGLDIGGVTRYANYQNGTNSTALIFEYLVQAGDEDSNGISITGLHTNGGVLGDSIGNNAISSLNGVGSTAGVKIDAVAPLSTSTVVPPDGTYKAGDVLSITVNMSEPVTVVGGTPSVGVSIGGTERSLNYDAAASTTTALVFNCTLQFGELDTDGIDIGAAIITNGATITDAAGNGANLSLNLASTSGILIDAVPPKVTSVDVPSAGTYNSHQVLTFTVNFDEPVTVNSDFGGVFIEIALDAGTMASAYYQQGSGTTALKLSTNIEEGYVDIDGVGLGSAIIASEGAIKDAAGNNAVFTLNNIADTSSILVDGVAPSVTSVSVPANGYYVEGQNLDFIVNFDEPIIAVDNGSKLNLALGQINREASYFSKTPNSITYRYTIQEGDLDEDGVAIGTLELLGTPITDAAGNDAILTLNNVADTSAVLVDAVVPNIEKIAPQQNASYVSIDGNLVLEFNEDVFVGTGNITLFKSIDDSVLETIDVTGPKVTGGGSNVITIDPDTVFDKQTNYYVNIDDTAFDDDAGNSFAGINDKTTWNFTTLASNNANLSSLELSDVTLSTAFAQDITEYEASVTNSVYQTRVTAVVDDVNATLKLNGAELTSGVISNFIPLAVGNNTVTVTVYAQNGETVKIYSIVIKRAYPSTSGSSNGATEPTEDIVEKIIEEDDENGEPVTTAVLDPEKIKDALEKSETTIVIKVSGSGAAAGELDGQSVKDMENNLKVLKLETENANYVLPAQEINIDKVKDELGEEVELKDIKVNIRISTAATETVKFVEDKANKGNFTVVVKPVDFKVKCTYNNKTIEVKRFNAYVERSIPIPDDVDPGKITTGVVLNEDGTISHVPTKVTIINGKYYAQINSLTNSAYSVIYNPKEFIDVSGHWSKEAVNDMASRLVINGYSNNNFKPDQDITRAEFAAIVIKALGLRNPTKESSFKDVTSDDWYYPAVGLAYEYDIIQGYKDGTFRPGKKITRQEAMAMMAKAMKIAKLDVNLSEADLVKELGKFSDGSGVSSWARKAVALAVKQEIVSGFAGRLSAKDNISRAETAVMVRNTLKKASLI